MPRPITSNMVLPAQLRPTKHYCFIGAGYVGPLTAAVMASHMSDVGFIVVDANRAKIDVWNSDLSPSTDEPEMRGLLRTLVGRNFEFDTNIDRAIILSDIIFITVDTPVKESDPQGLDTTNVHACMMMIARVATNDKIIVIKSTVPCGTADAEQTWLIDNTNPNIHLTVLSNPEFLSAGTAIADLRVPSRIVIGSSRDVRGLEAARTLLEVYTRWVPQKYIRTMTHKSAELTKLASNALLAQRVSSINTISMICEEVGADIGEVAKACGLDRRIGRHMLRPSLGFGGSCLEKDTFALASLAKSLALPDVGSYWDSVNTVNDLSRTRFLETIKRSIPGGIRGRKLTVLGCGFKPGSGNVAGSRGVWLICQLLIEGASVVLYDNKVNYDYLTTSLRASQMINEGQLQRLVFNFCGSVSAACVNADIVVIANILDELAGFCSNDWARMASDMTKPRYVFDGCRIVHKARMEAIHVQVHMIGES